MSTACIPLSIDAYEEYAELLVRLHSSSLRDRDGHAEIAADPSSVCSGSGHGKTSRSGSGHGEDGFFWMTNKSRFRCRHSDMVPCQPLDESG